jgi:hemerythrin-like domain-containing protein
MKNEQNGLLNTRRSFIGTGLKLAAITAISATGILSSCKDHDDEGQEVSPPEDLMQEHGLLNRVLLIYDTCKDHLINKQSFERDTLYNAATVIKTFVEDYHEKQEEDYLFPRFKKANVLTDLVDTLLQQHQAGRNVTAEILQLSKNPGLTDTETQRLIQLLTAFNTMYRPHESREDTVLFPAFRKLVSKHEYDSLGEEFEKNEQKKFGKDGFESMVEKVANIERVLGIYDLAQFTPKL